ncbi:MAG: YgjV family protein [Clostridia bacterium]|nr:YgjV family protein [Clostridia bacterium]
MQIILGNIIAFVASLIQIYAGYQKEKGKILIYNTIQTLMSVFSNILNNGISGAIINGINVIRNILCFKEKLNLTWRIIITIITIILSITFNRNGFIGFLPLIASISYIWCMNVKDVIKFKILVIFSNLLWLIYEVYINLYTSALFDFLSISTNIYAIIQINRKNKV